MLGHESLLDSCVSDIDFLMQSRNLQEIDDRLVTLARSLKFIHSSIPTDSESDESRSARENMSFVLTSLHGINNGLQEGILNRKAMVQILQRCRTKIGGAAPKPVKKKPEPVPRTPKKINNDALLNLQMENTFPERIVDVCTLARAPIILSNQLSDIQEITRIGLRVLEYEGYPVVLGQKIMILRNDRRKQEKTVLNFINKKYRMTLEFVSPSSKANSTLKNGHCFWIADAQTVESLSDIKSHIDWGFI